MGLFDNLFLDKNTPMAINIGDPIGSETALNAAPSSPGSPGGGGGGGSSGAGGGGNPPTPPVSLMESGSVSLSGGSGVGNGVTMIGNMDQIGNSGSSPTGEVSFDIGGDLGFSDPLGTNGDTPSTQGDPTISLANPVITLSEQPAFIVSEVPVQSGSISIDPMSNIPAVNTIPENTPGDMTSLTTPLSSPGTMINTPDSGILDTTPITEISTSSVSSTESPLMNLMSGFEKSPEAPAINTINPTDMPAPTPVTDTTSTDGLFSLMDTVTPPVVFEAVTLLSLADTGSIISVDPVSDNTTGNTAMLPTDERVSEEKNTEEKGEISLESHPMNVIGKELARMTRSPRLQGKLNGFIGELEELSLEEERLKDEKRKQIASYQTRIAELKTEYETRIHALELEEEDLKKQIIVMDEERAHITQVIYGFKQELEVV